MDEFRAKLAKAAEGPINLDVEKIKAAGKRRRTIKLIGQIGSLTLVLLVGALSVSVLSGKEPSLEPSTAPVKGTIEVADSVDGVAAVPSGAWAVGSTKEESSTCTSRLARMTTSSNEADIFPLGISATEVAVSSDLVWVLGVACEGLQNETVLVSLDPATGDERTRTALPGGFSPSALVASSDFVWGTTTNGIKGAVFRADAGSGEIAERVGLDGRLGDILLCDDRILVLDTQEGNQSVISFDELLAGETRSDIRAITAECGGKQLWASTWDPSLNEFVVARFDPTSLEEKGTPLTEEGVVVAAEADGVWVRRQAETPKSAVSITKLSPQGTEAQTLVYEGAETYSSFDPASGIFWIGLYDGRVIRLPR